MPAGVGINTYLHGRGEVVKEVPVADCGVLVDLDTPEEYERLTQSGR